MNNNNQNECAECWSSGGAKWFWGCFCFIGILLLVILLPLSIFDVSHDEYGLRYNDLTKKLDHEVYEEGKYVFTPDTEVFIYNKIVKTKEFRDLVCLTKDGVEVTLNVDVEYQLIKNELISVFWEFGYEKNLQKLIKDVVLDSVRDVCGQYNYTDFPNNRDGVESDMEETLKVDIVTVNSHSEIQAVRLVNYNFPDSLKDAIDDKQLALQDKETANNEREVKVADAKAKLTIAEINAQTTINVAEGKASEILLEAEESATAIEETWNKRKETYSTLMDEMGMDADEFVTEYLYGVILQNHDNTVTNL